MKDQFLESPVLPLPGTLVSPHKACHHGGAKGKHLSSSVLRPAWRVQVRAPAAFLLNPVLPQKVACSLYVIFCHRLPLTHRGFPLLTPILSRVPGCPLPRRAFRPRKGTDPEPPVVLRGDAVGGGRRPEENAGDCLRMEGGCSGLHMQ